MREEVGDSFAEVAMFRAKIAEARHLEVTKFGDTSVWKEPKSPRCRAAEELRSESS